jgi:DNA-directed RNA polymerase specialized sigma24 family protein
MQMPTYEGFIEKWKVDLIVTRAKRMRFRAHQLPDVLQDIVPVLRDFVYDPDRADGATERTALSVVIDNHLKKRRRSEQRYQARIERLREKTTEPRFDEIDVRAIDVEIAVSALPEWEQTVCRGLARGWSKRRIARELGCSHYTLNRIMAGLREHFRAIGLGGWIGHE